MKGTFPDPVLGEKQNSYFKIGSASSHFVGYVKLQGFKSLGGRFSRFWWIVHESLVACWELGHINCTRALAQAICLKHREREIQTSRTLLSLSKAAP